MNPPFFRADLHSHTTCSDGTNSPIELWEKAIAIGLNALAITDHDTFDAYTDKFLQFTASDRNLLLIYGAEFSASYKNKPVHILSYGMTLHAPSLVELIRTHCQRRSKRNCAILEKLQKQLKLEGHPFPEEFYRQQLEIFHTTLKPMGRPHIGDLLITRQIVANRTEAFQRYLGDHTSCYIHGESISIEETIDAIHTAGGIAVLAHPHLLHPAIVKHVLSHSFNGLEGYYARFGMHENQPWIDHALKNNWLITGGSDYHGMAKENLLGSSWAPEESFKQILRLQSANNPIT